MHPMFWQRGAYGHVKASKVVKLVAPAVTGHFALILQGIGLQYTSGGRLSPSPAFHVPSSSAPPRPPLFSKPGPENQKKSQDGMRDEGLKGWGRRV